MNLIQNPILKGFNPDPSIIRVGEDYYIATSTFEWFPGVQIHHSKDLINWELVTHPLRRISQLDMLGNPDSCGVWAPCLSYHDGTFYLVYSNVRSFDGIWKDTPNYLVTTDDILGEWSDPIFLSASGFDGSLFHDEDGRKWFTSMWCDHRKGKFFGGTLLQEYDHQQQKVIGKPVQIFPGSELGITEAPHIYKRNGYYYLITAEGGTEYGHAVSLARSESIDGPYALHPSNPVISVREDPTAPLQKCGHADLVETPTGEWYAVFLVGRPLTEGGRCILGRETAIEQVEWRADDWLYLKQGVSAPRLAVPAPAEASPQVSLKRPARTNFTPSTLDIHFQSLRIPMEEDWLSLTNRPGYLRLYGRESLSSFHRQSLVARRVQHFQVKVSACLDFRPTHFQEMAGLVAYYNTSHWVYLHISGGEDENRYLQLIYCDNFNMQEILSDPILLPKTGEIYLRFAFDYGNLQAYYALEEESWRQVGDVLDGSILSDDYVRGTDRYRPAFTGTFVGMCCQDLSGHQKSADFKWYEYLENRQ